MKDDRGYEYALRDQACYMLPDPQKSHMSLQEVKLTSHSATAIPSYDIPRQLIYHWGSNPSVSWDWWIDPNSSTYLIREEFKHMDLLCSDWVSPWDQWEALWPLRYPAWSDHHANYEDDLTYSCRDALYDRAQERAIRRMKKKSMKAARAQGFKKRDKMPGAWPL